ncbi:MAG: DUF4747 family protein [Deltaproteobacteria bacterium]|nr:DUF4747 family protein [Deltaproteobacteria bacterium]
MPRSKLLKVGILNITTHPHSPKKYIELFDDIFELSKIEKIRGSDYGMLYSLTREKFGESSILHGTICRFLNIDPNEPWFDTKKVKKLDPKDGTFVVPIPENLKPNRRDIVYIFFVDKHRLFIDTDNISIRDAMVLITRLCANKQIRKKYGEVVVNIESTKEAIDNILKLKSIRKLEIYFAKPNPDDLAEVEKKIMKRLNKQNVKKIDEKLITDDEAGIKPDDETQALMYMARSNGKVIATSREDSQTMVISTKEHPLIETEFYHPERDTVFLAMKRVIGAYLRRKG